MSEGNSKSGDAPKGDDPNPDIPPYDAPTEVFGAVTDDGSEQVPGDDRATDDVPVNSAADVGEHNESEHHESEHDESEAVSGDTQAGSGDAEVDETEAAEPSEAADPSEAAEQAVPGARTADDVPTTDVPNTDASTDEAPTAEPVATEVSESADPADGVESDTVLSAPQQTPVADESPTVAQPVVPAQAVVPAQPDVPAQPEVSGDPAVPGQSVAAGGSAVSEKPTVSDEPTVAGEPVGSERSAVLGESASPAEPQSGPPGGEVRPTDEAGSAPPWRKIAIGTGAVVAVLAMLYAADWIASSDRVPRGVTVAGIDVGGKAHSDAEAALRSELGPRAEQPVQVDVGDRQVEVLPAAAGLGVDWNATLDRAGSQPINPITRLTSFFGSREIGVVSTTDEQALNAAVDGLRAETDREPVEGDVVFDGATPVAVAPLEGRTLDADGTRRNLQTEWASGATEVVYESTPVTVTQDAVDEALDNIAAPAVEAPVIVSGRQNVDAVLAPERVGEVLSFDPDGQGGLTPVYNTDVAAGILAPQLVRTEVPPKDASFTFSGGAPTVVPGVMGELVEWRKTLEQLPALLSADGPRTTEAIYEPAPPALTTEGAENLGVREVIAEYTTGGFEYASGVNIGLTAQIVNGALVKPKETFSLNGYTGPRGTAQGFVESGIIDNGRPDRAVGGGISQFATTLYNASYFAGMEDTDHTEHSYYISRYPEAREATVFEGAIDLKFTNPNDTGVLIQSFADSSSVTVRLWGTKTVDVESITGSRTNFTSPNTVTLPAGDGCVASGGGQGFTASDTRVISDAASGRELSRNTRTVKYDPIPIVRCVQPDRPDPSPEPRPNAEPEPEPDE
ncbi:VanW family protein [Rhodococcus sp. NPDC078407]|uniref:VanW family protein n=1 Tax=Rhodococcus sp. NPDC078407 TaxID=3364509 RepID=UPI0037C8088C